MVQILTKQNIMFFWLYRVLPTNTDKVNTVFSNISDSVFVFFGRYQAFLPPRFSFPLILFIQKFASSILSRIAIRK